MNKHSHQQFKPTHRQTNTSCTLDEEVNRTFHWNCRQPCETGEPLEICCTILNKFGSFDDAELQKRLRLCRFSTEDFKPHHRPESASGEEMGDEEGKRILTVFRHAQALMYMFMTCLLEFSLSNLAALDLEP
jgi:hypothetical protein